MEQRGGNANRPLQNGHVPDGWATALPASV
jgi:hypothetical protein